MNQFSMYVFSQRNWPTWSCNASTFYEKGFSNQILTWSFKWLPTNALPLPRHSKGNFFQLSWICSWENFTYYQESILISSQCFYRFSLGRSIWQILQPANSRTSVPQNSTGICSSSSGECYPGVRIF